MEEKKCPHVCVTVTDLIGIHGPCTAAGQHTCFISPVYEVS
jgi:hypothetical protein